MADDRFKLVRDCATLAEVKVGGLLHETALAEERRNLGDVCPGQGLLVPLFTYNTHEKSELKSELTALRLILQADTGELLLKTKTYGLEQRVSCVSGFFYQPTLG